MRKLNALPLVLVVLVSILAAIPMAAFASDSSVHEYVVVIYTIPPTDDSMTDPDHALLNYHWYSTINYYINPTNSYGFSTSAVVNTITTSANTWDVKTTYQVFSYKGTTSKTAGTRDGYNVVSWGSYQAGAIAVTYIWARGKRILETDCRMHILWLEPVWSSWQDGRAEYHDA